MTCFFFLGCDVETPNGGLSVMYRIVDVLNRNGLTARMVQEKRGYYYPYADHPETLTIPNSSLRPSPGDLILVPEWNLGAILREGRTDWNVSGLFQMTSFNTDSLYNLEFSRNRLARNRRYFGSIVVSKYLKRLVMELIPEKPLFNAGVGIDVKRFKPGRKRKQIAFNAGKGEDELRYLLLLLRSSQYAGSWRCVPIYQEHPEVVRKILRESAIYVTASPVEGLGMLALEAMASEALVIGFDGIGGREFFRRGMCLRADTHDVLDLFNKVKSGMNMFERDPAQYHGMTSAARQMVVENYDVEKWEARVLKIFSKMAQQLSGSNERGR